jgi:hypothetical protein
MRGKTIRGTWLLAGLLAVLPAVARGQEPGPVLLEFPNYVARGQSQSAPGSPGYAPADPQIPVPLGSTRPEDGGLYLFSEFVYFRQPNPLRNEQIALRGFIASDNSLGVPPSTFIGSRQEALNVDYLNGQVGYQPGFNAGVGWKFKDGSSLSLSIMYLAINTYSAGATLVPRFFNVRPDFADSFITAPVFNFPSDFSGPPNKINSPGAGPFAAYGIWNAANIMTIRFDQRFQQWDLTYRYPVLDYEDYRMSAVVGPRFAWIWERFRWTTTAGDNPGPLDVAIYNNIDSNRMYGVFAGCQQECYLGHGFAVLLDTRAALLMNTVKERVSYETGLRFLGAAESKKSKHEWTIVPEFQGMLGIQWYPTEFVQVQFGYDLWYFMNTLVSTRPVDFNYLGLTPHFDHVNRLFDGFRAGIAIWF